MFAILLRTTVLYLFVIFGLRLMGKRQIGDMQPNELVITLLISEIAAIPLQDTTQPILSGVLAIFVLVIVEILLSVLAMKSFGFRKLLSGSSVVIIQDGKVDQGAMKRVRLTVPDLIELLRGQNVFDLTTVAFAVLETDGNLSVLLKSGSQSATRDDLNCTDEAAQPCLPVISDGKIVADSLTALQLSEEDVAAALKTRRLSAKEVFLMTMDAGKKTYVIRKEAST